MAAALVLALLLLDFVPSTMNALQQRSDAASRAGVVRSRLALSNWSGCVKSNAKTMIGPAEADEASADAVLSACAAEEKRYRETLAGRDTVLLVESGWVRREGDAQRQHLRKVVLKQFEKARRR